MKYVQVSDTDVATRLATILVIHGCNLDEAVRLARVAGLLDRIGEVRQRHVRDDGSVVRGAGVVLDLLEEHYVRTIEEVGDVISDQRQSGRRRSKVVNLD